GTGDDIQALKAGIIEIADILVVNKADRPGADVLVSQLRALLSLAPSEGRDVPILSTVATTGDGVPELVDAIDEHRAWLDSSGELDKHRRQEARHQVLSVAQRILLERVRRETSEDALAELVAQVAGRGLDPHTAAEQLVEQGELV
ncbi:MAG: methylmalonyl Co-A mutase-associated GTPase MeaB, partial [Dehalococcoidia bacterium]|nr:methylmalonyl Co-A mutase-associated GTPase MeaB [Dehalococcoidia bacterium]